jgi:hypothetical protein
MNIDFKMSIVDLYLVENKLVVYCTNTFCLGFHFLKWIICTFEHREGKSPSGGLLQRPLPSVSSRQPVMCGVTGWSCGRWFLMVRGHIGTGPIKTSSALWTVGTDYPHLWWEKEWHIHLYYEHYWNIKPMMNYISTCNAVWKKVKDFFKGFS